MNKKNFQKSKKKIYYNVSIPHNDLISVAGSPTPAVFSEIRDEAIFNDAPKNWDMSVIRFSVPTTYIPIQFFPVEPDPLVPLNPNKSIYSITLSYNGNDFQQYLTWQTQDNGAPIPPPPTGLNIATYSGDLAYLAYYSVYSFNHFADLINVALDTCYQNKIVPLLPVPVAPATFIRSAK